MPQNQRAILVKAGKLIDGSGTPPRDDMGILIESGRFARISPWQEGSWPSGKRVQTVEAPAVIPGLIDIHIHITSEQDMADYLRWGVTTVRDVGTDPCLDLLKLRDQVRSGTLQGPRIFSYGPLLDGPDTTMPCFSLSLENRTEAIRVVDRLASAGVNGIKLYWKLPPRTAKAVIARARLHRLPTAGHIGLRLGAVQGARMGIDSIEHLISFMRDFTPRAGHPVVDLLVKAGRMDHPSKGWPTLFKFFRRIDPDSRRLRRVISQFLETGSAFHPTLVPFDRISRLDDPAIRQDPRVKRMRLIPEINEIYEKILPPRWSSEDARLAREGIAGMQDIVGAMYAAGIPIGAGTDSTAPFVFPGEGLHQEMALLVKAGIPEVEAIRMASMQNAATLGHRDLGHVAEGKTADLVLLDQDPTLDIRGTQRIRCVMKDGRFLTPPTHID